MQFLVADFETFFSADYTLSKSTTEAYIRDPQFEAHGCAFYAPPAAPFWIDGPDLPSFLTKIDWSNTDLVCWHAQFDGLILNHHYNVRPRMWFCPMSMSRLLIGNHVSVSLDSMRSHFGLPPKITPYNLFKGKHWNEMPPVVQQQVAAGACNEVVSIWNIFTKLARDFPQEEFTCVDTTIRMFTEPVLGADLDLLAKIWEQEDRNKSDRLLCLGVGEDDLQSAARFAELLRAEGIEPETKSGKSGDIFAFAKTDLFMQGLLEHEDERVRMLTEARLGVKSTLLQTRAEALGWMARRGPMCVYLRYAGAHTTRWSGGDTLNWQNSVPQLNSAIKAPDGYLIASPDSSQVECRILNYLAGQDDKIEDFRQGRDPYVNVASAFYGYPINKKDHPEQRQVGKVLELQCGFQSGAKKIQATLRNKARITISDEDAERAKQAYRNTHPAVVQYWKMAGRIISRLAGGEPMPWGPMRVESNRITLPNGAPLFYPQLHHHQDAETGERFWRYKNRHGWSKIYSGSLVENCVQALARVVVSQAMVRIVRSGFKIFNMRHDDIGILIPHDGHEQEALEFCKNEMRRTPDWLPGIPLDAEGSVGTRYEK